MATSFESFFPEVLPHIPGCPGAVALNAVRNACREFCKTSTIWRENLTPLASVIDQATYAFILTAGTEVVLPTKARYDDNDLDVTSREEMDYFFPNWEDAESGTPDRYLVETPGTIRLYVPPSTVIASAIEVEAALKPAVAATTVGDIVYNDWLEAIAAGALSRLMKIPKSDWSDPALAVYYEAIFQDGIARARYTIDTGHVRRSRQVKMQRW